MNEKVTDRQIVDRLEENGLPYARLGLQNGVSLIISQLGGRVLGPFLQPGGESLFWVNPDWRQPEAFRTLVGSGWNLGGERWWVSPEFRYLCRDRHDYWNAEFIQPEMDPGRWRLEQAGPEQWRLAQEMTLETFNPPSRHKALAIEALVESVPDPLRLLGAYPQLADGVTYAGYEQTVTLSERRRNDILSAAWNIVELYPGGEMLIPAAPCVEVTDYMEPVDEAYQQVYPNHVRLQISGRRRYLTGYKAAHVTGRLAYHQRLEDGRSCLLVRQFTNDPASPYLDEPPERPGHRGDSVRVYNDDGAYGGYGEAEVYGRAIGGDTGRSESTDRAALWMYVGTVEKLGPIALHLLGIELYREGSQK